jgi:hypothetical protein
LNLAAGHGDGVQGQPTDAADGLCVEDDEQPGDAVAQRQLLVAEERVDETDVFRVG